MRVFARKDARVSDGIRALYEPLTQLDTQHQLWNREQQTSGAGRGNQIPGICTDLYNRDATSGKI